MQFGVTHHSARREKPMTREGNGRLVGIAIAIVLLPIYLLFSTHGHENRGFIVVCITGVSMAAAYVRRRDYAKPYVIIAIFSIWLIEIAAGLTAPLPATFPGAIMIPISLLNIAAILWLVRAFEHIRVRRRSVDPDNVS